MFDGNDSRVLSCPGCLFQETYGLSCCSLPAPTTSLSFSQIAILFALVYVPLVQVLRFRRRKQTTEYVRANQPLTPVTAQAVVLTLAESEFPMLHKKALEFALFRTYGIPTISSLLEKTTLFSRQDTAARRYVDTKVLIGEFMARDWGTQDWVTPMARLNAIHGHYRDKGQILEADMLYTLLLFAQQPAKWIDRFDWRKLSHEERDALGTFWQGVAAAMEIHYDGLGLRGWEESPDLPVTANGRGRGSWKDGADWIEAVDEWAERYEQKCMVPAQSNAHVAEETVQLLLYEVPKFLHPFGRQAVSSLMDARLRRAMAIPEPSTWVHCTVMSVLLLRKFVIRWLLPPRPNFLKERALTSLSERTGDGRHHLLDYENMPYYVAPTLANRWGLRAWMKWSNGQPLPGDEGMESDGYVPVNVGPGVGKAAAEQAKREHKVEEVLAGRGCPLAFSS